MLDIFAQYATDESLENNGTWFKLGKDSRLLVARAGNRAYSRALTKQVDANRVALDANDEQSDKVSDDIMADVMAQTILLGWENVGFQGEPLPYSHENAKKLLRVKDFRVQVARFSDDFDAYRIKQEAEQGKA